MSQSLAPEPTTPSNSPWRFGVYLFPIAPISTLGSAAALRLFAQAADTESLGVGVTAFVVTVLAGWLSVLFAAVVAVALIVDAFALREHPSWNPNPWIAGAFGLVHLAGTELVILYLLSVPGIGYYVYRRWHLIGRDGGSGGGGPAESTGGHTAFE